MRVLVVDDDDDTAMGLVMLVRHCGHEAQAAIGGKPPYSKRGYSAQMPMFIDWAMPTVDGFDVARQLRTAI